MFVASSIIKLIPASPINIYDVTFVKPAATPQDFIVSRKNTRQPNKNTPVFTTGQVTAAAITARYLFFLANAVRNVRFGENVEYCGPILEKYEYVDNKIKLFFSHALGLNIKGEGLRDFYVYSKDGKALPFDIQIDNNCLNILLTTNLIPNRITLGYNNAPEHNLYNAAGYLASPFDLKLK